MTCAMCKYDWCWTCGMQYTSSRHQMIMPMCGFYGELSFRMKAWPIVLRILIELVFLLLYPVLILLMFIILILIVTIASSIGCCCTWGAFRRNNWRHTPVVRTQAWRRHLHKKDDSPAESKLSCVKLRCD